MSAQDSSGVNLERGRSIELETSGRKLTQICVGLNWGVIKKPSFFGLLKSTEAVDLDGSVAVFDRNKNLLDQVYYRKLESYDGAIKHSGDDLVGDTVGDDGLDNEIITVDLLRVNPQAQQIVFFLNSFKGQDFADIPYAKIRIYEGDAKNVKDIFASFNLASAEEYDNKVSVIMGKLVRGAKDGDWSFHTIGEPVDAKRIPGTIEDIQAKYL